MKVRFMFLAAVSSLLTGCCLFSSQDSINEEQIVLGETPRQNIILLQNKTNGDLACCRDTEFGTAEECAQALEKECYVRVQDIPYRTAKYDFLTEDTYPTRRWRENETAPRW